MKKKIVQLQDRRDALCDQNLGEKQHAKGKLTARERLALLLDRDSFVELEAFVRLRSHEFNLQKKKCDGDGVIVGYGKIGGRKIYVYAQDFTQMGGSLGEIHAKKIMHVQDLAMSTGCPIIGIIDFSIS